MKMESCIDYNLIPKINIEKSWDLEKYLLREDSTYFVGNDTCFVSSTKLVPTQGYIDWKSNISMYETKDGYTIRISNYIDTSFWRDLVWWDGQREIIFILIKELKIGKMDLLNYENYKMDTTISFIEYYKMADGGDIADAVWKLDLKENNNFEISKIDTLKKVVEGNFQFYFNLSVQSRLPPSWGIKYSDKAQFRCGKFKTKLIR